MLRIGKYVEMERIDDNLQLSRDSSRVGGTNLKMVCKMFFWDNDNVVR